MRNTQSLSEPERAMERQLHSCVRKRHQMQKQLSALVRRKRKAEQESNAESNRDLQVLSNCLRELEKMELNNEGLRSKKWICDREVAKLSNELRSLDVGSSSKHPPEVSQ